MVFLVGVIAATPVQAARISALNATGDTANTLSFDIVCSSSSVCQIQNASLDSLNGNFIWFYQQVGSSSDGRIASLISLELPDGSSRGFASFGTNGGSFSLGRDDGGSLVNFVAKGTFVKVVSDSITETFAFHAEGTYILN